MIRLIIIFWNVLFSVAPTPQSENPFVNPLYGYHIQAQSEGAYASSLSQQKNDINKMQRA
jgi:hypothetical protein